MHHQAGVHFDKFP